MKNEMTVKASKKNGRKQFTKDERKAYRAEKNSRIKALADAIGKLTDDQRKVVLEKVGAVVTIEEHKLSVFNTLLLCYQRTGKDGVMKGLSVVGGFQQWKKAGRRVKKGEKGLYISFPSKRDRKDEDGNPLINPLTGEKVEDIWFNCGVVFDISQTEPIEFKPAEEPPMLPQGETIDVECEVK